jgi:hypothetical protein
MKTNILFVLLVYVSALLHAAPPSREDHLIASLTDKGVEITKNADGKAIRIMVKDGKELAGADFALIGKLTSLEQVGINGAPLGDGEWVFLKSLPKLKQLSIWHGAEFSSLEPFSGLPVESLTIGGCMGLRDKNKGDVSKLRNVITTLYDLPNLTKGNWYHSPLVPDDLHLKHIANQFPKLTELRLDFAAPAGSQTSITPAGLAALQKLPLAVLGLENAHSFTATHFQAIASIKSLKTLTVDARKQPAPTEGIAAFQQARPDVEVAVSLPGDQGPPMVKKRGNRNPSVPIKKE